MERKLASIQVISEILEHPNADKLEIAKVLGWNAIVLKGQFHKGDEVVYIETDAILKEGNILWEFMRDRKFHVKTVKLRGSVSQGLIFNSHQLLAEKYLPLCEQLGVAPLPIGTDVTDVLEITKHEVQIPAQLAGQVKGSFPEFLYRTDEQRIQGYPEVLERYKGQSVVVTEKVDGTSFTAYWNNNTFGICSRNLELKEDENNTYWKVAKELQLKEKLDTLGRNLGIQGELIGMGIQKNKYGLPNVQLKVFNIFDIDKGQYLEYDDIVTLANKLQLDLVPLIDKIKLDHTVEQLVEMSKGYSQLNSKTLREGLVFRVVPNVYDPDLHGRASWKAINSDFLLKYDGE